MGKKKKHLGNLIYEYGAGWGQQSWPEGREISLFQLRLESWWFPQVKCGFWLPAQSSTMAALYQFFPLTVRLWLSVWKLQPTLESKGSLFAKSCVPHIERIAFNRHNTRKTKEFSLCVRVCVCVCVWVDCRIDTGLSVAFPCLLTMLIIVIYFFFKNSKFYSLIFLDTWWQQNKLKTKHSIFTI